MTKIITNPKTGMLETEDSDPDDAQARLQKTRRELRDMLGGNIQFHADDLGPSPIDNRPDFDRSKCTCSPSWSMGMLCTYCLGDYNPETVK